MVLGTAPIITLSLWSGTICVTMFYGRLPFETISWHGTTVTILQSPIPNAGASVKCNTVVQDICGTKCNVIIIIIIIGLVLVTALNTFPDSLFINPLRAYAVFKRSTEWSGWFVGTKLPGCCQLRGKKNSPSTINNHLLERICVTVIWPIFL